MLICALTDAGSGSGLRGLNRGCSVLNLAKTWIGFTGLALAVVLSASFAVAETDVVESAKTGATYTLDHVLRKYDSLKERTKAPRAQYETLDAYNKRISRAVEAFDAILDETFDLTTRPSDVSLDWENATLRVIKEFPLPVARLRHSGKASTTLELLIRMSAEQARVVSELPEQSLIRARFRFSRSEPASLLLQQVKVTYGRDEIFREG